LRLTSIVLSGTVFLIALMIASFGMGKFSVADAAPSRMMFSVRGFPASLASFCASNCLMFSVTFLI